MDVKKKEELPFLFIASKSNILMGEKSHSHQVEIPASFSKQHCTSEKNQRKTNLCKKIMGEE